MLRSVWIAHDDSEETRLALEVASDLARGSGATLTLVHVAPVDDEPGDKREEMLFELFGLSPETRARQRLRAIAAQLPADVSADVRVAGGPVADTLLDLVRQHRPDVVVAGARRRRLPRLRPRIGHVLAAAAPCSVVLVSPSSPHAGQSVVGRVRMRLFTPDGHRPRSLLLQLFGINALVLAVATLLLVFGPVSVSRHPVLAEMLVLGIGLAVMLAAHLLLLRRTLAPLRDLTDLMGAIDLRRPGRRLPEQDSAAEVVALAGAFNAMLDRLEDERRESVRRALAAQEDERLRIAREMHDQIGQTLTAMTLQAERAAHMDAVDRRTLEHLAGTALQSLEDVRRLGRELRPEALDDLGLGNALITLCRRMGETGRVRVTHELEAGLPALSPEAELVIYRIAQEAITNALRHAHATRVRLWLRPAEDAVELTVRDDGIGLPATLPGDTAGLVGMRERALLIGADLNVHAAPGGGTEVRLAVPLHEVAVR